MSRQGFDASDTNSASSMIMKIIENKIFALVHTAFLAEVTSVTKNKVDVKMLKRSVFAGKPEPAQEVKGLLVGFPGVKKWSLTMPISIGDIGLAIICQDDISGYKSAGMGGVPPTTRRFAVHDSIFIPLSMYLQPDITEDFIIKSTDDKTVITLKKEGEVTVTGMKIDVTLDGESNISAKKDIKVTTDANITAKCKDLSVTANGKCEIECADAKVKAQSSVTVECSKIMLGDASALALVQNTFPCFFTGAPHTGAVGNTLKTKAG